MSVCLSDASFMRGLRADAIYNSSTRDSITNGDQTGSCRDRIGCCNTDKLKCVWSDMFVRHGMMKEVVNMVNAMMIEEQRKPFQGCDSHSFHLN